MVLPYTGCNPAIVLCDSTITPMINTLQVANDKFNSKLFWQVLKNLR